MIILVKHSNWFYRQKYTPHRLNKEWVLWNTNTAKRIYGPDTRDACLRELSKLNNVCSHPNKRLFRFGLWECPDCDEILEQPNNEDSIMVTEILNAKIHDVDLIIKMDELLDDPLVLVLCLTYKDHIFIHHIEQNNIAAALEALIKYTGIDPQVRPFDNLKGQYIRAERETYRGDEYGSPLKCNLLKIMHLIDDNRWLNLQKHN